MSYPVSGNSLIGSPELGFIEVLFRLGMIGRSSDYTPMCVTVVETTRAGCVEVLYRVLSKGFWGKGSDTP